MKFYNFLKRNEEEGLYRKVLFEQDPKCKICHKRLQIKNPRKANYATLDEIKPRSKGGKRRMGNLQLLCRNCNARKDNKWEN